MSELELIILRGCSNLPYLQKEIKNRKEKTLECDDNMARKQR